VLALLEEQVQAVQAEPEAGAMGLAEDTGMSLSGAVVPAVDDLAGLSLRSFS
jgi:hypothetical protein